MGLPNAQPPAAHGEAAAAAAAPQLGQDSSAAGSAVHSVGLAAVSKQIDSAGQETTAPANLTGTAVSSAKRSQERMHRLAPAGELAAQKGGETDKTAVDVQHVQTSSDAQTLSHAAEAEPVRGLADPNKRLLAKMGSHAPADVSKQLLQEVAARSHVEGLLQVCRLHIVLGTLLTNIALLNMQWQYSWLACQQHQQTNCCGSVSWPNRPER